MNEKELREIIARVVKDWVGAEEPLDAPQSAAQPGNGKAANTAIHQEMERLGVFNSPLRKR